MLPVAPTSPRQSALRTALAGLIGNVLEWFDFAVYGYFAGDIGGSSFRSRATPRSSSSRSPCSRSDSAARPIGSLVLGPVGDRIGRRALLTLSIVLMGGATLALGLLPTYDQIGVAAPILLVTMRLVQGFSLGGEFTGSMVYTTELSSPMMRGLVSSSTAAGTTIGFILGSGSAWLVNALLEPVASRRRGDGACRSSPASALCILGWFLRRGIHETAEGLKAAAQPSAARAVARRRLAADRADVRHRRDDERRVLPDVHVRGRAAEGPDRRWRRDLPAREHAEPGRRAAREAVSADGYPTASVAGG